MTDYDYGPLQTYEITHHSRDTGFAGGLLGVQVTHDDRRIQMHGEFDGHWRLVLSALEDDIRTIRLVTGGEEFAGQRFDIAGGEGL